MIALKKQVYKITKQSRLNIQAFNFSPIRQSDNHQSDNQTIRQSDNHQSDNHQSDNQTIRQSPIRQSDNHLFISVFAPICSQIDFFSTSYINPLSIL